MKQIRQTITVDDQQVMVIVTYKSTRNFKMKINDRQEVIVTAPLFAPRKQLVTFITHNKEWIAKHIKKSENRRMYDLRDGGFIYFQSNKYTIKTEIGARNSLKIDGDFAKFRVMGEDYEYYMDAFKKFFKKQSDNIMRPLINKWCQEIGLNPNTISYRYMKTRWGVCNYTRRKVTLNTMLLMFDNSIIEYVIVHELCHFFEQNHSKMFWSHVEHYMPNYKSIEKKMKLGGLSYD